MTVTTKKAISKMNKRELLTYIDEGSYPYHEGDGDSYACNCRAINISADLSSLSKKAKEILFEDSLNGEFWLCVDDEKQNVQWEIDQHQGREIVDGITTKHNVEIRRFGPKCKNLCLYKEDNDFMFEDLENQNKEELHALAQCVKILYDYRQFMINELEYFARHYVIKAEKYKVVKIRKTLEPINS